MVVRESGAGLGSGGGGVWGGTRYSVVVVRESGGGTR